MEERKLLLAVALSLLVLTAYSMLFPPAPARPRPAAGPSAAPSLAGEPAPATPAAATHTTNAHVPASLTSAPFPRQLQS